MRSGGNFRFISNFVRKLNAQCVRMNNASYSWGCDKLLRYRNARFSSCSICSCAKIVAFTVYYKELYDTTPTMIYYRRGRRGIVINNENRTFVEFWVWEIRERYNGGGRGEWGEEEKRQSTTAWSIIMWSSRVKNTYYSTYFTREEIIVTLVSHRLYICIYKKKKPLWFLTKNVNSIWTEIKSGFYFNFFFFFVLGPRDE